MSIRGKMAFTSRILTGFLFYVTFFTSVSFSLSGQSILNDTVKINEVVIRDRLVNSSMHGFKMMNLDSTVSKFYGHSTLSDLLSENTPVYIKSYGAGGSATASFRGSGATHTQIAWNDININNPMLGQSDFSLIPAGLIDNVQILFGNASMGINSGGIGGIINLETKPVWKKETFIDLSPAIGSFGRYSGLVNGRTGNENFQSVTKIYLQKSENNFRYMNDVAGSDPIWETRKNNQLKQQGYMQELYFKRNRNVMSARVWYQSTDRNLPGTMITQQTNAGEKQFDESLRTQFNFSTSMTKCEYFFTTAGMLTRLDYSNRMASIESENFSRTFVLKGGMNTKLGNFTKLKMTLNNDLDLIKSGNYGQNKSRNTIAFAASAERKKNSRLGSSVIIREILDRNKFLIPDFSAGIDFRLFADKDHFLKMNVARNSKIPSLNDLFWSPGGNSDLKNEYSYTVELNYESELIFSSFTFKPVLSVYSSHINDMIQWLPEGYSYWVARNIKSTNCSGAESLFNLIYSATHFNANLNAGYSYTRSMDTDNDGKKQLMYIPENQANASLNVNYRGMYSSWTSVFTGKRFISVDNSKYLPGYSISNIVTGIKIKSRSNEFAFDIRFKVENVFNVNYQTIAYYPQPGRAYIIGLSIQFIK